MRIVAGFMFALGLLAFGNSQAQEAWTLQQCIGHALEKNIQVRQQGLMAKMSANTLDQSKYDLLPSLNLSAQQSYSFGRSLDMFTNSFNEDNTVSNNLQGSASLDLFNGLAKQHTIRKNRYDLQASLQDVEKIKNDIALAVTAAFLQVLYAGESKEVAASQLEVTRKQVERTQRMVEAGSLARGNLLEVVAQAAGEEAALISAGNQLDLAYLSLAQLLEIDDPQSFRVVGPALSAIDANARIRTASSVYAEAVERMPQIRSAEFRLKSAEAGLAAARGNYLPRLSVNAIYTTGYSSSRQRFAGADSTGLAIIGFLNGNMAQPVLSPVFESRYEDYSLKDQFKDNAYRYLTFNLNIPVFNGLSVRKSVSNAKLQIENNRHNLDLARKQLMKDIQQAEADANAALKSYLAATKSQEAIEESFRYVSEKFELGMLNPVDFNLSKNQLFKSRSDLIRARYEYLFKVNVLEFYRGNPLSIE